MLWGCALGLSSYRAPQDAQTPGGGFPAGNGTQESPHSSKGQRHNPHTETFSRPSQVGAVRSAGPTECCALLSDTCVDFKLLISLKLDIKCLRNCWGPGWG